MHPSAGLTREYLATTDEAPTRKQLASIAAGGMVDGSFVKPALVDTDISDPSHGGRKLRIIVSEGRNREVGTPIARRLTYYKSENQSRSSFPGLSIHSLIQIVLHRCRKAPGNAQLTGGALQLRHVSTQSSLTSLVGVDWQELPC